MKIEPKTIMTELTAKVDEATSALQQETSAAIEKHRRLSIEAASTREKIASFESDLAGAKAELVAQIAAGADTSKLRKKVNALGDELASLTTWLNELESVHLPAAQEVALDCLLALDKRLCLVLNEARLSHQGIIDDYLQRAADHRQAAQDALRLTAQGTLQLFREESVIRSYEGSRRAELVSMGRIQPLHLTGNATVSAECSARWRR